jgi:hypothetical protein
VYRPDAVLFAEGQEENVLAGFVGDALQYALLMHMPAHDQLAQR